MRQPFYLPAVQGDNHKDSAIVAGPYSRMPLRSCAATDESAVLQARVTAQLVVLYIDVSCNGSSDCITRLGQIAAHNQHQSVEHQGRP